MHQNKNEISHFSTDQSNRELGTAESLFDLQNSKDEIYANCVQLEQLSKQKPADEGIRGIEKLLRQSLQALNVSKILAIQKMK